MPHYETMFDKTYLGHWDLPVGREAVVTIAKVTGVVVIAPGGVKNKRPAVWFEGKGKALLCNKTNARAIAAMYGPLTEDWAGKRITIYRTTTEMAGEQKQCLRVRPTIPTDKPSAGHLAKAPVAPPPEPAESDVFGDLTSDDMRAMRDAYEGTGS